ncbi:phage integrase central domain-containing protein [Ruegeria atlantica]|uniref:phage integrase central domain-containing protein n=1 Tax=Ruegeria atlantica TaxID=81569 RepID=UPI003594941A
MRRHGNTIAAGLFPQATPDRPYLSDSGGRNVRRHSVRFIGRWDGGALDVASQKHILPRLGSKDVAKLTAIDVRDTLSPIWRTKTSSASKSLDRHGITMRHAAARYLGEVDAAVVPKGSQSESDAVIANRLN